MRCIQITRINLLLVTFSYYDVERSQYVVGKYHGKEDVYVDNVKLCGTLQSSVPRKACITFRVPVSVEN